MPEFSKSLSCKLGGLVSLSRSGVICCLDFFVGALSGVPCKAQDRLPHRCRTELPGIQPAPSPGHIHFHLLMIKLCISDKILLLTYKSLSVLSCQTSRFIMSWI